MDTKALTCFRKVTFEPNNSTDGNLSQNWFMRCGNRQNIPPLTVSTLVTGTYSTGRDRVLVGTAIENIPRISDESMRPEKNIMKEAKIVNHQSLVDA